MLVSRWSAALRTIIRILRLDTWIAAESDHGRLVLRWRACHRVTWTLSMNDVCELRVFQGDVHEPWSWSSRWAVLGIRDGASAYIDLEHPGSARGIEQFLMGRDGRDLEDCVRESERCGGEVIVWSRRPG